MVIAAASGSSRITGKRVGWLRAPTLLNADALADSVEFYAEFFENAPLWYAFAVTQVVGLIFLNLPYGSRRGE